MFTGIGAICWLPDIRRWARVVSSLLRPGGRLLMREGHPVLWALEYERPDGLLALEHAYFEREEPEIFDEPGSYVETDVAFEHNETYEWNHGVGEILTALLDAGLAITRFEEHDSVPWEAPARADGADRRRRVAAGRPALAASPQLHAARRQARRLS